ARLLGGGRLAPPAGRDRGALGAGPGRAGLRARFRLGRVRLRRTVLPRVLLASQRRARPGRPALAGASVVAVRPLPGTVPAALQPAAAGRPVAETVAARSAGPPGTGLAGGRRGRPVGGAVQARRLPAAGLSGGG